MPDTHALPLATHPNILSTIGRTPMVRLSKLSPAHGASVWAKCEFLNPGGSAKDRIAASLLRGVPTSKLVVEASSGNTAIALAQACAVTGHKLLIVCGEKVSEEKRAIVRAFGADLVVVKKGPRETAARLAKERNGVFLDQFSNPAATDAHYETTGPEILEQLPRVDAFVCGIGTGGTLSGVARRLKERDPRTKIVVADPPGSLLSGPAHPYQVEGIGVDFDLPILEASLIDTVVSVKDETSFEWARRLAREEGILAGGSSGAAVFAANFVASRLPPEANVVALLADTGRNYLSKFFAQPEAIAQWA